MVNAPHVRRWAIVDLFFYLHVAKDLVGKRQRLRLLFCFSPELWDLIFIALAHGTLVIVAKPLLCPEWALTLKVHAEGPEEGGLSQLLQHWVDLPV